jgi:hypothetical protein
MDPARMPMMGRNDVGGTGTHNLRHWDQNMKNSKFADIDGNEYDTSVLMKNLANTKMCMFVGANDALAQPEDFALLEALLPEKQVTTFHLDDYNHLDYMWAKDTPTLILPNLYKWLDESFNLGERFQSELY